MAYLLKEFLGDVMMSAMLAFSVMSLFGIVQFPLELSLLVLISLVCHGAAWLWRHKYKA